MSAATPRIIIDPFFDAPRGGDAPSGPRPIQATTPGYLPADREFTESGRTVAQTIGTGPAGLRATIIPKATMGGVPAGTNPHRMSDVEVTIDPHIPQQSSRVRLGDITAESLAVANTAARAYTPEPTSLETLRLRGSAVMHGIALQQHQQPAPMQAAPQAVQDWGGNVQSPRQVVTPQQPARRVSPLSAFNQQPAPMENREQRVIMMPPDRKQEPAQASPPTIRVVFENEHVGEYEAYYHDVVIQDGFIVLIYDVRCTGPKYFPPVARSDKPPILALNVVGDNAVYQVQTTGVHYVHRDNEHCVLMVDSVGQLPGT